MSFSVRGDKRSRVNWGRKDVSNGLKKLSLCLWYGRFHVQDYNETRTLQCYKDHE